MQVEAADGNDPLIEGWNLHKLRFGQSDRTSIPSEPITLQLVDRLRARWIQQSEGAAAPTLSNTFLWVCGKLGIQNADSASWEDIQEHLQEEEYVLARLTDALVEHRIEEETVRQKLYEVADVLFNMEDVWKHTARLRTNVSPHLPNIRYQLPPEIRQQDALSRENENVLRHDETKNTPFQNVYLHLRQILQGCAFRRADGKFFKRIVISGDHREVETLAFQPCTTVEDFVGLHTAPHMFKAWRWITSPPANFELIVKTLKDRPLAEAPDLEENLHLRSYAGDAWGRGAGVYNSRFDLFFPYHNQDQWVQLADQVQSTRRKIFCDPKYTCSAPDAADVCVVHLKTPFPFDILHETTSVAHKPLHLTWRECHAFECARGHLLPNGEALARVLAQQLDVNATLSAQERVGRVWQPVRMRPSDDDVVLVMEKEKEAYRWLRERLKGGDMYFTDDDLAALEVPPNAYIEVSNANGDSIGWMPWVQPPMFPRATFTQGEWEAMMPGVAAVKARTYVTTPHDAASGLTWYETGDRPPASGIPLDHTELIEALATPSGLTWTRTDASPKNGNIEIKNAHLAEALKTTREFTQREWDDFGVNVTPLTLRHVVKVGDVYFQPVAKTEFTQDEWDAFGIPSLTTRHFVEAGGTYFQPDRAATRYFCVDTGRAWNECATTELDHVFTYQGFTPHDLSMIYASMGRLFFRVGELDNNERSFALQGIAGCGKSTVLAAYYPFWPPHRLAVLSSNMQPQFGMSSLAHGAVAVCDEMKREMGLPQEEWQMACKSAPMNMARKHKEPLILQEGEWIAQFLFAGNEFPEGWNNLQGQVTRRMAGVFMSKAVNPRDSHLLQKIKAGLGALQRRSILAYFAFLDQWGSTDPMSDENHLPPAFADFFRRSKRKTDPVEDFLCEGSFVEVVEDAQMSMTEFRAKYNEYRLRYDLGKSVRWSEDAYRTAFAARGVSVKRVPGLYQIGGRDFFNEQIITGLRVMDDGTMMNDA